MCGQFYLKIRHILPRRWGPQSQKRRGRHLPLCSRIDGLKTPQEPLSKQIQPINKYYCSVESPEFFLNDSCLIYLWQIQGGGGFRSNFCQKIIFWPKFRVWNPPSRKSSIIHHCLPNSMIALDVERILKLIQVHSQFYLLFLEKKLINSIFPDQNGTLH